MQKAIKKKSNLKKYIFTQIQMDSKNENRADDWFKKFYKRRKDWRIEIILSDPMQTIQENVIGKMLSVILV